MGCKNPTFANTNLTVSCELPVFIEYLRMCGFESLGLTRAEMTEIAKKELFYPWVSYQAVLATLKNSGFKLNICYFLDENFHQNDDQTIMEYVQTCKTFKDYNFAAQLTIECFKVCINYLNNLELFAGEYGRCSQTA